MYNTHLMTCSLKDSPAAPRKVKKIMIFMVFQYVCTGHQNKSFSFTAIYTLSFGFNDGGVISLNTHKTKFRILFCDRWKMTQYMLPHHYFPQYSLKVMGIEGTAPAGGNMFPQQERTVKKDQRTLLCVSEGPFWICGFDTMELV